MGNQGASKCVGIIGVGNMGEALLAALISAGQSPSAICFAEKRDDRALEISTKYGAQRKELEALKACDVILLVVKPQDLGTTLGALNLTEPKSLISFIAGKKIAAIEGALAPGSSVIRVMPNTPALIGKGMSALSRGTHTTDADMEFALHFLRAAGRAVEVSEDAQDAVTATSGSGPAYFFAFVEAMINGATNLGLPAEVATELTVQTIIGAAGMLEQSGKDAKTLRENVTSPNGTTAAALATFGELNLTSIVSQAMNSAAKRSEELSQ